MHTTDGSADAALGWFADTESRVSSHYVVSLEGRVWQLVDEEDTARHAGRVREPTAAWIGEANPNLYTVGIEFEDGGDPERVLRTEAQYRAGGLLLARICARWQIPLDREHVIGHREVFSAKSCPGNLDIDRLLAGAASAGQPRVLCLAPVRNAAEDLPGWFESAACVADAVIALDDGSTDATGALLEQNVLVQGLLAEPVRDGYGGWDDAANRRRLLAAAGELEPKWILFLDVDERIDADDADALRRFLERDAVPGCAYGLELHRMWGDDRVVPGHTWVYRVFAWAPGLELRAHGLHFNPVPVSIRRRAWVRTTVRVRHLDSRERLAQRLDKYAEVDPGRAGDQRPSRLLAEPGAGAVPWPRRDPALPVLDPAAVTPGAPASRPSRRDGNATARARLLCLLPVRNGAGDIPEYLGSVEPFADGVIALDDGSTDATAELLAEGALVEELISNPPRDGYADWDDARNRARLLEAALRLGADWVFWLDADERLDPLDAEALRDFVDREADRDCAYGFRVFRMIEDLEHYDEAGLWAYRLFAPVPGQELPAQRLHLVPVPTSIPRSRWRKTTFRIQHLAGLGEAERRRRLLKYREADAGLRYQADYSNLLREPGQIKAWRRRPAGTPALADPLGMGPRAELDLELLDLDAPVLSAIVIARNDEQRIERSLRSVVEQRCPEPYEVIAVVSGTDRTAEIVRERFPDVKLIELEGEALPGRARNAGVAAARGDYLSFPGSHVELPPGSLAARIRAHRHGHAMVTGSILNGTGSRSGWASYFLDHATSLPGRPSGGLQGPPDHCSYVRDFVLEAGGFPEDMRAGEDTVVNRELVRRGHRGYRAREVELVHRSPCTNPWRLAIHHFRRGRALGRIVIDDHRGGRRLLRRRIIGGLLLRYVRDRLRRTRLNVERWGGDLMPHYRAVRPLLGGAVAAAWTGLWFELLRPGRGKLAILFRDQRGAGRVS